MTSKKILKMNMPEVNLYIVTVGIASIFLLYYNFYIGVLFFIGFLYMVINNWKTTNIRRKEWTNYIQNLSLDIDETTKKAVMNLPIPLCILEFDGRITWYNGKFNTMIGEDDLLGVNIDDLIKTFCPGISHFFPCSFKESNRIIKINTFGQNLNFIL